MASLEPADRNSENSVADYIDYAKSLTRALLSICARVVRGCRDAGGKMVTGKHTTVHDAAPPDDCGHEDGNASTPGPSLDLMICTCMMCMCVCVCVCVCMHVCMYVCIIRMYIRKYVYVCITYVCVCV